MRKALRNAATAALMVHGGLAFAGWHSGGGELYRDALNPWFLQNTPTVKACILSDPEHFHLPPGKPDLQRDFIEPVLRYWQHELKEQPLSSDSRWNIQPVPRVATQRFVFGPCDADTDVRFQFGVLTQEQLNKFYDLGGDPQKFVSIAVRTDYDTRNLRAKGFVYIAADSGDLQPSGPGIMHRPWARGDGGLLLKVLAHEMGHIWGLPHSSPNPDLFDQDLMSATYPEAVVSTENVEFEQDRDSIPPFFTKPDTSLFAYNHPLTPQAMAFLGAPPYMKWLEVSRKGHTVELTGLKTPPQKPPAKPSPFAVGTITLATQTTTLVPESTIYPMRLWLPPDQTVFSCTSTCPQPLEIGPGRETYQQTGVYKAANGDKEEPVFVTIFPPNSMASVVGAMMQIGGVSSEGVLLDIGTYFGLLP